MTSLLQQALGLYRAGRFAEAEPLYRLALDAAPGDFEARVQYGLVLQALGRDAAALAQFDRAIRQQPGDLGLLVRRGALLGRLGRFDEALAAFARVIARKPDSSDALFQRAMLLAALHRHEAALEDYRRLLDRHPGDPDLFYQQARSLFLLRRFADAIAGFDAAIARRPGFAEALNARGIALWEWGRMEDAAQSFEAALAGAPDHAYAMLALAQTALYLCDWTRSRALEPRLLAGVAQGRVCVAPFIFMGYSADNALLRQCAENFLADRLQAPVAAFAPRPAHGGTLRIAYLSLDYREHATAYLMAGLFEAHDRDRFEVIGISLAADDGSDIRARLENAFDRFHDISALTDNAAAALLHDLHIDIAVDINVYTQAPRPALLAGRPAPVQVNYLGYPGTSGAAFLDYIVADKITLPFAEQPYYSEKIVHLPHCYQVNDDRRPHPETAPPRAEAGLPEQGFVFCCFNANWKITPEMFDIWARLLRAVEGSVLWLIATDEAAQNLRHAAAARGVDPARLVFAPRVGLVAHLARHRLADLFLDTLPYNAHTTASDALWMGLPLVTMRGAAFAGRVAASLLNTIGLCDLIAENPAAYEALALALARDPARLAAVKDRLARNRTAATLFDTARFTRGIEAAYERMWALHRDGRPPESFAVGD